MERTENIFREYLNRNGLPYSEPHRAVFAAFMAADGHISAEEIHDLVNQAGHKIGIAAVWRALRLIQKAGLAEEHYFGRAGVRYEKKKAPKSHGHIVCQECGHTREFDLTEILPLINKIAGGNNFNVDDYELSLFGKCRLCFIEEPAGAGQGFKEVDTG